MSLLSLPPELSLQIAKLLKPNREALRNFRLATKSTYDITTEVLFEEVSIHYGVTRSVSQMNGLADSPTVRPSVRSLFLPGESFFPISEDFTFPEYTKFPWTRNPERTSDALNPPKKSNARGNHLRYRDLETNPTIFHESPSRPWVEYNPRLQRYKRQRDEYTNSLVNLIKSLPNLKRIHIAIGVFWAALRMDDWCILFRDTLWRVIADTGGVCEIEISIPRAVKAVWLMFGGYDMERLLGGEKPDDGRAVVFPNITSFKINVNSLSQEAPVSILQRGFTGFFSHLPNLTSYSFKNSHPLISFDFPPPASICPKLSSLHLSNIKLEGNNSLVYRGFQNTIAGCSLLECLELDTIVIVPTYGTKPITTPTAIRQTEGLSYLATTGYYPTYIDAEIVPLDLTGCPLPDLTWGDFFAFWANSLKMLKGVGFRRLVYGRKSLGWGGRDTRDILLPMSDSEPRALAREVGGGEVEVISPFRRDYSELQALKRKVSGGSGEGAFCGDGDGDGGGEVCRYKYWRFGEIPMALGGGE
ncbi:hypothetical protein TWF970_009033 [Orbilia oligospora]|uniref:Uncharacterized protein n=1 Tax=Orbilia oligospora TaxID=2813651 RepID=A0A7C8RB64_ORBOL|nr:hypothetical protein TWF970_009033 [Orbilia oligospora]